jgi:eukaryotic-like serine/threonine-protein kinase
MKHRVHARWTATDPAQGLFTYIGHHRATPHTIQGKRPPLSPESERNSCEHACPLPRFLGLNAEDNAIAVDGAIEVRAGLVLGRYELLVPIAAGGMAQVWAARMRGARQFQKIVAVKTMLPKLSDDAQFEQMFLDEASLASQVRHPNAVEILDLGDQDGILYLVMEWIEGVPLNQLMKASKLVGGIPPKVATRITINACAGLHAAHELKDDKNQYVGLVHRDVSPQNLLVTYDGVTKVVDFGVAKATALGGGATVAGQVKGKVSYMAPEQVNGEGLDRRADVFALGIVLYALTTGKHPFRRESEAGTMFAICSPDPVVPPSKVVAEYPPELELIVLKSLEKDRDKRFFTCDEMLRALDSLPSHLRASSDADVAEFVTRLMGERRTEQRQRLEAALARAEEGGLTNNGEGHGNWNGRPGFGTGSQEVSGLPEGMSHGSRNKLIGVAGLVALVLSGGILVQAIRSRSDVPREVRVIEVADKEKAPPTPVATPTTKDEPPPPVDVKDPPPAPRPKRLPVKQPPPPTPDPDGSWKERPGF